MRRLPEQARITQIGKRAVEMLHGDNKAWIQFPERTFYRLIYVDAFGDNAHAGCRTGVTNMGGVV